MTRPSREIPGPGGCARRIHRPSARRPAPPSPSPRLFEGYEHRGHADPAAAWTSFTMTWNWAAQLPRALPADRGGAVCLPAEAGYLLSGTWQVTDDARKHRWLTLTTSSGPFTDRPSAADRPDTFVIATRALPRPCGPVPEVVRLDGLHVPAGFVTSSAARPLCDRDASFLWTAVTAMALGAARRLAESLPGLTASGAPLADQPAFAVPPQSAAAQLGALALAEYAALTARLRDGTGASCARPAEFDEALAAQVRQAGLRVHQVAVAAYEYALSVMGERGPRALESLLSDCTALLQHVRYTTEFLPCPPHGDFGCADGPRPATVRMRSN